MKKFEWYGFQETFDIILNEVINNKKVFEIRRRRF